MRMKPFLLLGVLTLAPLAQAEGVGLGIHAGLMGPGIDGYYRLDDKTVLRGAYNAFDYDYDATEEDVDYDATFSFNNAQLGVDYYPFAGSFRLSAAYVQNNNELNLLAVPRGGSFDLNDTSYAATDVGSLRMQVSYPGSGAYLGLGWGNPVGADKRLGVTFDLGAYYLGKPEVVSQLACGATASPATCAQLKDDAEADRKQMQEDLSDFPFWPLLQLGLSYQF